MDDKTIVLFRIERRKHSEVLAVFPYLLADLEGNYTCYERIGQHGAMHPLYLKETRPVNNPDEYNKLLQELISIGYDNLEVHKRVSQLKYDEARKTMLKERNSK